MSQKKDLQVLAQEFGLKHKLKNYLSPTGIQRAVTELGSSKYKERMEVLREADSSMRETAVLFKDYLKNAQRAFKDNRYLDVAHWCSMINDGVKLMMKDAKSVVDLRDAEIAEYYTRHEDANPEHNYFAADDGLVSTAGFLDKLFGNSIEKLYWKKVRESKLAVQSLISKTEKLVAITYSSLDRMGNARAHGNIGSWIEDLQRIGKAQGEFQIFAKGVYDKHLKGLADIVKLNKPQAPVEDQSAPKPTSSMTHKEYMEYLNDNTVPGEELADNEPFDLKNKKENIPTETEPVAEEKIGPGRPALNDPRSVKVQNDKELEQWSKVQDLLKGNKQPEPVIQDKIEEPNAVESIVPEVVKPEEKLAPSAPTVENKIETPKVDVPKIEAPVKPIEAPKQPEIAAPKIAPVVKAPENKQVLTPTVPQAPAQTTVQDPPKRGRGRPKSPATLERERLERERLSGSPTNQEAIPLPQDSNPFSSAPVAAPKISTPTVPPKAAPVHVDIKGKNPDNSPKPTEKANVPDGKGEKITFVMIPKIIPDNLNKLKEKLETQLGTKILYVTKANGAEKAKEYMAANWDITPITYDEALAEVSKNKDNTVRSPLELLNDPEFVASLSRLGNGNIHGGELLHGESYDKSTGKYVRDYPEFQNMDKATTEAVIKKLNEINEANKSTAPNVEKPVEAPKSEETKTSPVPVVKNPELSHYLKNLEQPKTPETTKTAPVEKKLDTTQNAPPEEELSEDEKEQRVFIHTGLIEKLVGKSMKDVTSKDIFQLLGDSEYMDSLPREKNTRKKFDWDAISNLPEIQILKKDSNDSGYSPYKVYLDTLKGYQNYKIPYPKPKAAYDVNEALVKLAHKKFYIELEKVAKTQNKGLMAALMCKYSEEIENIDSDMSIKLLLQAEKLVD